MADSRSGSLVAIWLAVCCGVVLLVAGGAALWFLSASPVHSSAETIVSAVATPVGREAAAIETGRGLARRLMVDENVPGVSVAVAVDGAIVWAEGFGWAGIAAREQVTPRTRFRLGAASKPLTGAVVARLHDEGRLDLDAPIQTYVADYPPKPWPLTTRHLLGDVGGVARIRGDNNDAMPDETCASLGEAFALFKNEPLLFRPGSEHRYSIYGWVLLSVLIERVGAEPFPAVMRRELFTPLGMADTVLEGPEGPPEGTTTLYGGTKSGRVETIDRSEAPYSCLGGAGAFLSTPSDLVRFGSAMLKPGLLKADTFAAMQTPVRLDSGASSDYALGWKVEQVTLGGAPARMIGHRGRPMGGAVSFLRYPDHGLVVAVAANTGVGAQVEALAQRLADVFVAGRPALTPGARPTAPE